MTSYIKIAGDRPFPFIFCSKNYALSQYGAFIKNVDCYGGTSVNSSFPIENIIDGNRSTYSQIECIGKGAGSNYVDINLDVSNSGFGNNSDDEINMIVIESDPYFPTRKFKILSYTNSTFTSGEVVHNSSKTLYTTVGGKSVYYYGVDTRCDTDFVTPYPDPARPEGFDGRYAFIFLDNPIDSSHRWIRIEIKAVGRNLIGYDGAFTSGMWYGSDDEVLDSSDPCGISGSSGGNYIKLWTDSGTSGHQTDQFSSILGFTTRPNSTYVLRFNQKQTGSKTDGYRIMISYYDRTKTIIGSETTLYASDGSISSWTESTVLIGYMDLDGKYKSGEGTYKHELPSGTCYMTVKFKAVYQSGSYVKWQLDDISIYNSTFIPAKMKDFKTFSYGSTLVTQPLYHDMSGICRIRRIGTYGFKFSTSTARRKTAFIQDIGGMSSSNPQEMTETSEGKSVVININNRIINQFVPRGGVKRSRVVSIIGTAVFKNEIMDLDESSYPFGVIDPQCDFSDYVVSPGTMSWVAMGAIKTKNQLGKWNEAPDFMWNGTLTLREV